MLFWIISTVVTFLAALVILAPILRRRVDELKSDASDVAVYKDQLKELDGEVARGTLSATEAETSRIEISRRLLAADDRKTQEASPAPSGFSRIVLAGSLVALVGGTLATYAYIGAPGLPDRPLASRSDEIRPSQDLAQTRFQEASGNLPAVVGTQESALIARLYEVLEERPDDLEGHQLLVSTLSSKRDFAGAWEGQVEVLRILGDDASASDFAELAELMVFAAGGYISPEADNALAQALTLDPSEQRARYYSGISMAQNGRPEMAMRLWIGLLQEGDPNAPSKDLVRERMRELAANTGLSLPESILRGPSAEDVEAAQEMSPQERQEMIRGMVEGLNERLATEGGTAQEWARLIGALGVLGEEERAREVYAESLSVFAEDDASLAALNQAAQRAGLQ